MAKTLLLDETLHQAQTLKNIIGIQTFTMGIYYLNSIINWFESNYTIVDCNWKCCHPVLDADLGSSSIIFTSEGELLNWEGGNYSTHNAAESALEKDGTGWKQSFTFIFCFFLAE